MSVNLNWQPGMTLESIEKMTILQAYKFYKKNKTQTALALGMSLRTLHTKLEQYGEHDVADVKRIRKEAFEKDNHLRRARGLAIVEQQPEETEDERNARESAAEQVKRENHLRRAKGQRAVDPNSLEADLLRTRGAQQARAKGGEVPAKSLEGSERGIRSESDSEASTEHEMPVPFRKEVQGMLPKQNAGVGTAKRR